MSVRFVDLIRRLARVSGSALAVAYAALVLGHILQPDSGPPTMFREWLGIALLSTSCLAILIAWRWELLGGLLSLTGLLSFVLVVQLDEPIVIGVIALPGVLYLLDWISRRFLATASPR